MSVRLAETQEYQGLSMLPAFKQRLREKEEFLHKNERDSYQNFINGIICYNSRNKLAMNYFLEARLLPIPIPMLPPKAMNSGYTPKNHPAMPPARTPVNSPITL